jgi:hypothetical protein
VTLDQLLTRDRRIEALERLGRARTREQDHELGALIAARDHHWRRLPRAIASARAKASALETYARQHRLPLEGVR